MPAPHPPEFRHRAVELARQGTAPVARIAKDLGISESCLRNWMAQADADENGSGVKLTSAEKEEIAELRRKNRQLEMEKRDPEARGGLLRPGESESSPIPGFRFRWPAGCLKFPRPAITSGAAALNHRGKPGTGSWKR
jgi:transposase